MRTSRRANLRRVSTVQSPVDHSYPFALAGLEAHALTTQATSTGESNPSERWRRRAAADGTYSFSRHRSGTFCITGGVAAWLEPVRRATHP